jgi:hypothetical protein
MGPPLVAPVCSCLLENASVRRPRPERIVRRRKLPGTNAVQIGQPGLLPDMIGGDFQAFGASLSGMPDPAVNSVRCCSYYAAISSAGSIRIHDRRRYALYRRGADAGRRGSGPGAGTAAAARGDGGGGAAAGGAAGGGARRAAARGGSGAARARRARRRRRGPGVRIITKHPMSAKPGPDDGTEVNVMEIAIRAAA